MSRPVVITRTLKPEWLDETVELYIGSQNIEEVKTELNRYLADYINSKTNLIKTRSILLNTWVNVDDGAILLRDRAVHAYKNSAKEERIAIHWAMMLVAFPFFRDLCAIIGKLSDMQSEISTAQIRRRVYELWGERTTLACAIDKNMATLCHCGVIKAVKSGRYVPVKQSIKDKEIIRLLIYAVVHSDDKLYHGFSSIMKFKELFPFDYDIGLEDISGTDFFSIDRMGGEIVVVK